MAQSISARANLDLSVTVQDAADSGELGAYSLTLTAGTSAWSAITESLTNGSGQNQVNKAYWAQRTLAASANDDLDLTALTDRTGTSLSYTEVKLLLIRIVTPTTGYYLTVGGGSNAWLGLTSDSSDRVNVYKLLLATSPIDGFATVDGTHKTLRLNNPSAGSVVYDILILGH